jgi:hypothetical protein
MTEWSIPSEDSAVAPLMRSPKPTRVELHGLETSAKTKPT